MKPGSIALVLLCALLGAASAQAASSPRFVPVAVYLDSPEPVAAWQFELSDRNGAMKVVGVESGSHAAFSSAPYYDRGAVARGDAERIVVADFSLAGADQLPHSRFRLATLHLMLAGEADFELRLITAATPEGRAIEASITLGDFETNPQEKHP